MTDSNQTGQDPNTNAINSLNAITNAISQLTKVVNAVFPQSISTSLTATSGAIIPKNYAGYLVISDPLTGGTVKIGYFLD
jgi:hypothetical protein